MRQVVNRKIGTGIGAALLGTLLFVASPAMAQEERPTEWNKSLSWVDEAPLLVRGDTGPDVAEWQDQLNDWLQIARTEKGRLTVDGVFGSATEAATRDFQRAQKVTVDGLVGPETRAAWLSAPALAREEPDPATDEPFLARGDTGPDVAEWQDQLNDWLQIARTEKGRLTVDGVFGPATEAATRDFQRAQDVTVDALVGPETRAAWLSAPALALARD